MKHNYFFILISLLIFPLMQSAGAALPDLTVTGADIIFSNDSPEPGEVISVSATIVNYGDTYFDPATVASHDYNVGISSIGFYVHGETPPSSRWYAQYFVPNRDLYLGKISIYIRNCGITSDSITVEVRRDLGNLRPGAGNDYLLASQILVSTFTSSYSWQDFIFDSQTFLTAGSTYWICAESTVTPKTDAYLWWIDSGTPVDMLTASTDQGLTWSGLASVLGIYNAYYRVYQCTTTVVSCYKGNPDSGGELIDYAAFPTPIPEGGSKTFSFSWTAVQGSTDIYIAVDYQGIIQESLEDNNIAHKTINVASTLPCVIEPVFPEANSSGISVTEPVRVSFSENMDSASVINAVSLKVMQDNLGASPPDGSITGIAEYADRTLTLRAALEKGYTYQVTVSTQAKDLYGNSLSTPVVWIFSTIMDCALENTVISDDNKTSVTLKPSTVENDYYIVVDTNPLKEQSLSNKVIRANDKIRKSKGNFSSPLNNSARKISIYEGASPGTELNEKFQQAANIEIPYIEANNGLVEDSSGLLVKEKTLRMYWLDEQNSLWLKIPDSVVDTEKNIVKAGVYHFSLYALFGGADADLSAAYAYPVPWKPFAGKSETGTLEQGITFTGLGSEATIRIYTISGEFVKALNYMYYGGEEQKKWDGTNEQGELVASGTYIYYIENDKEHKSGKLIIIK